MEIDSHDIFVKEVDSRQAAVNCSVDKQSMHLKTDSTDNLMNLEKLVHQTRPTSSVYSRNAGQKSAPQPILVRKNSRKEMQHHSKEF